MRQIALLRGIVSASFCLLFLYLYLSTTENLGPSWRSVTKETQTIGFLLRSPDSLRNQSDFGLRNTSETWYLGGVTTLVRRHLTHLWNSVPEDLLPLRELIGINTTRRVRFIFGIPTVKRKVSYLVRTLTVLLQQLSATSEQVLIIVQVSEVEDTDYIHLTYTELKEAFVSYIDRGLLEIITPPTLFYPKSYTNYPQLFKEDSKERIRWRSKQNLDYVYLMMYAYDRCDYYVQLEDDLTFVNGFFGKLMKSTAHYEEVKPNFQILSFSSLGYIGKLTRRNNLFHWIDILAKYFYWKPCDFLFTDAVIHQLCASEDFSLRMVGRATSKECENVIQSVIIQVTPPLFDHVGYHSSLDGKVSNLKEKNFKGVVSYTLIPNKNPEVEVNMTLHVIEHYPFDAVYKGNGIFWAETPRANDVVDFVFKKSANLSGVFIRSGFDLHPNDTARDAYLEISSSHVHSPSSFTKACSFVGGICKATFNNVLAVSRARIIFAESSDHWVAFSKFSFLRDRHEKQSSNISVKVV